MENSDIRPSVEDNELDTKVLIIPEEVDASADPGLVEDCHRLPFKGNIKGIILKLNPRKDVRKVLLNKNIKKLGSRNSEPAFWHKNLHQ